ncbi:hypothetical protein [Leifsonia poae]|uniref:hypothetical protein n=1 Tax=Leifsonia poae TaxID=110933 RepID=UPI001CBC54A3|nr:hypothetical protein [Leifsonia poae]
MAYAPTLIVSTDAAPCPRAEVLFTSFAAGTSSVDVYRLAADREYLVRGAVKAAVAGALSRIDFEIPFGVPVQYRAEMFDAAGLSLGFTDTATVTVDVRDTWVHNRLTRRGRRRLRSAAMRHGRLFARLRVTGCGRLVELSRSSWPGSGVESRMLFST